jgi:hypothetical protein
MPEANFPKYNSLQIQNVLPKFNLRGMNTFFYKGKYIKTNSKIFIESGALFHPMFPGLSTIQFNYNTIIQNSNYNIVLQFNQLCNKDNLVAKMKFTDEKSLNELNKLNGYKIYLKK